MSRRRHSRACCASSRRRPSPRWPAGTGDFADAEDAVQEALVAAADGVARPTGVPDNPLGWLVHVASRRMIDQYRARRPPPPRGPRGDVDRSRDPVPAPSADDTLIMMFMCCHPALRPSTAIPLTLRAVAGLTTREIAAAFLVPEATMAQRISRAKATLRDVARAVRAPDGRRRPERLRSVLHVLYLLFNEGYATSSGPELARTSTSPTRRSGSRACVHAAHARRPRGRRAARVDAAHRRPPPARTGPHGELVPLADQDRTRWDRAMIREGVALITDALRRGAIGEYQAQAAIAARARPGAAPRGHRVGRDPRALPRARAHDRQPDGHAQPRRRRPRWSTGPTPGSRSSTLAAARSATTTGVHAVRGHLLEHAGRPDEAVAALRLAAGPHGQPPRARPPRPEGGVAGRA